NSFSGGTYTGTAPYQTKNTTANGWSFIGLTDASKSNTDTGFKGVTKQADDCRGVIGTSSPNKDDLKRIYIATKSVTGFPSPNTTHVFLELAWVRIAQNTTSPSAHVGFEFNQSKTACGAASDGLVQRTAGDLLFVYDFEGSSTSNPSLTFRRWVTSATSTCEIGSDSPPCWGTATNLSASGFAEAKVNTFGSVLDTAGSAANPPGETLGTNEFGEAGADLTNAGIFTLNETLAGGWLLESLVCTPGGAQDATTPTQADITDAEGATVTCTYTNQQQLGAIKISKISSKPAATALSMAHFELCTNNG